MSKTIPIIHVVADPVLLDKVIADIQAKISTIPWMAFSFGRAFKHFKLVDGTKVSYPAIFQNKGKDYYSAYPNDNIKSQSFIFAEPTSVVEFNVKRIHNIENDISIVIFFDLQEIDDVLDYRFTEKLKEDVIFVLSNLGPNRLQINNITDDVEEAFSDFTPSEIKSEFLHHRFGAFKVDCTVFYKNDNCALNVFSL